MMRLLAQIVQLPGSPPRLALGLPPGCGEPARAFLDTAAAFTVVGAQLSHALAICLGRPGRALRGVGGYTPSVDCGELPLMFSSNTKVSISKPQPVATKPLTGPVFLKHRSSVLGHL